MNIIDSHAHIYLPEFEGEFGTVLQRARDASVMKILMPAIDSNTHDIMLQKEEESAGFCAAMMGLHPCSVRGNYEEELKIAAIYFSQRKFVAVGETGLDFYWDKTYTKQQYDVFHRQIEWALQYDIPVVIHSRNSIDECIQSVSAHQKGKLKGVFHCFSGNAKQAGQIIDLGFYLGIGGVVTFKNAGLDKELTVSFIDNIVLETDSPYLAPAPFRGKRNEPAHIKYVVEKLAEVFNMKAEEVVMRTTANTKKLFGL